MNSNVVYLETIAPDINGFTLRRRYGPLVKAERLPQYTVWQGAICLEEFRRLASARKWARENRRGKP